LNSVLKNSLVFFGAAANVAQQKTCARMVYSFENCHVDVDARTVTRDGDLVHVERQVFQIIVLLIERRGRVVSKDDLVDAVWGGRIVSDGAIASRINAARRALGDDGRQQRLIKTRTGVGFQFVAELSEREVGSPSNGSTLPRVCVVPFCGLGSDQDFDFLAQGIAEEVTTLLSTARWLTIIAPGSLRHLESEGRDVRSIASDLGVDYVAQGTFLRSGARIRLNVTVHDGTLGAVVVSRSFEREYDDLLAVLGDVAREISGAILPEIQANELASLQSTRSDSITVWEAFLRACALLRHATPESCAEADALLVSALELEPAFAPALARRASCALLAGRYGWNCAAVVGGQREVAQAAKAFARMAIAADPKEALGYEVLAAAHQLARETHLAERMARRAIELSPICVPAYGTLAAALAYSGDVAGALRAYEDVLRVSPRDPETSAALMGVIIARFTAGQYQDCIREAEDHRLLRPNWYGSRQYIAASAALLGDLPRARAAARELLTIRPHTTLEEIRYYVQLSDPKKVELMIEGLRVAGVPET
jgi:DNA-binding winged helix-turn-helix (wHTH) protein/tetratricopeptide (TPR) repeat protein